jgi:uncharacterized protein
LSDSDVIDDASASEDSGDGESAETAVAVLEFLVKSLVDNPDDVRVESDNSGRRLTLNVHVADGDMGRVIGKRGRVAQSIRTVTRAAAVRDDVQIDIEFVD